MQNKSSNKEQVLSAGLQLLLHLYGGEPSDSLNELRYAVYCKLAAVAFSKPKPERLPPTKCAAAFHILCTHLQAVRWVNLNAQDLDPRQWGWQLEEAKFVPIYTDLPAAPDDILNVVRCKCKTGCQPTSNCSCRTNSLTCVTACTNCRGGDECSNAEHPKEPNDTSRETDSASELDEVGQDDDTEEVYFRDSDIDWEYEEEIE